MRPGWIGLLVFIASVMAGYVSFMAGRFNGMAVSNQRAAVTSAKALYEQLQKVPASKLETSPLYEDQVCETLVALEKSLGRVRDFEVTHVGGSPLGIPLWVELKVRRERGTKNEVLFRYSPTSASFISLQPDAHAPDYRVQAKEE